MIIKNPANDTLITKIHKTSTEDLNESFKELREGQKLWAAQPLEYRLNLIKKFGELILANKDELAKILTTETGKPITQSLNEIQGAQNRISHLSANVERWLANEELVTSGQTLEHIAYEPLGVIANISAWNFPYNVGFNVFLYALVAGNAVIYKPSEFASLTGMAFEKYLLIAGVPANVFKCVLGDYKVGKELLQLPFDGYFFTGSHKTGVEIARSVAHKLVPVVLELGGKDPLYVAEDVIDVQTAAIAAAEGAFYNNGQSCCAVERIYVADKIYDQFVDYFTKEVSSYTIGDPLEANTFIGPLTRKAQIPVLENQIEDALQKGAKLCLGGMAIKSDGYYFQPTVLKDCNHSMLIMEEESFGPIIGIQRVSSDQEAIEFMQDTAYGLTAAVFSSNRDRALAILKEMDTGTVYWNCCDRVSPNIPWSGRKNSGLRTTLSAQGIRAFVQPKAYHIRE